MQQNKKKSKIALLVICSMIATTNVSSVYATESDSVQQNDSFENYDVNITEVESLDDLAIAAVELSEAYDDNTVTNTEAFDNSRLIVQSQEEFNPMGAVELITGYDDYVVLQYDNPEEAENAYDYYKDNEIIDAVDPDVMMYADSCAYNSWGYADDVDNEFAINISEFIKAYDNYYFNDDDIVVAVVDTGIRASHEIFKDNQGNSRVLELGFDDAYIEGLSYSSNIECCKTTNIYDDNGHGTHVAGIIAEATPDNVKLMSVKVFSSEAKGSLLNVILGLRYAIENNSDVINLSISSIPSKKTPTRLDILDAEIERATEAGIIVCAAAGNNGMDASYVAPANCPCAITVGAVNSNGELSAFSNYGDTLDIVAPGTEIYGAANSDDSSYVTKSGTSQATPHVSAVAALLKLYKPDISSNEALSIMQQSADRNKKSQIYCAYDKNDIRYKTYRLILGLNTFNDNLPVSVSFQTHIQNIGWDNWVSDGAVSGTTGQSKRLEGIKINVAGDDGLGVVYSTHVQDIGWTCNSFDGEMSGTTGKSKRLEAIMIELTGENANKYDIYYRVHAQNVGWLSWAKNGEPSGTAGYAYRLEAIQIAITQAGEKMPDDFGGVRSVSNKAYVSKNANIPSINKMPEIVYQTHVQNIGWQGLVSDGETSGTSGKALRLEAIRAELKNQPYSGGISYITHIQDVGWQGSVNDVSKWKSQGQISGTTGYSRRLEAICIKLTGEMAQHYDVYYRVHVQNVGWQDWVCNGEIAGTQGRSLRLEAIEIKLVNK